MLLLLKKVLNTNNDTVLNTSNINTLFNTFKGLLVSNRNDVIHFFSEIEKEEIVFENGEPPKGCWYYFAKAIRGNTVCQKGVKRKRNRQGLGHIFLV